MNLVDSSAWLDYFANGPNAAFFTKPIEQVDKLIVPSLSLFEVFNRVLQQRDEHDALQAIAIMQQGVVADLDASLAVSAARLSVEKKLPVADSVILAKTREYNATQWTQDADFKGLEKVQYRKRRS